MSASPLVARLSARLPDLAAIAVAALLAGKLALVVWQLVPGAHRSAPALGPATTSGPPAAAGLDAQGLLGAHLFGAAPVAAGPIEATNAALVLTGTLAGPDPTRGWAILGETASAARLFAAGSTLPSGIRLLEVYTDHVLIERNGVRELLSLPRKSGGSGLPSAPAPVAETPIAENVQRALANDPGLIGQVLRPQPVFANGQLRGFRLYPGTDRGRFARLGLQPGDLVTEVNNVPIADPQHGMDVLRTLGNATSATITVERNGSSQQLSIDSSKIAAAAQPTSPAGPSGATPPLPSGLMPGPPPGPLAAPAPGQPATPAETE